jgi:hypothetical protein
MSTFLLTLLAAAQAPCGWDLATDWSDAANPHGPWSYNAGANAIPTLQPDWIGAGNPMWAAAQTGFGHIPAWGRLGAGTAVFGPDATVGAILVHGNDPANGTDVDLANVTWTSPVNSNLFVHGALWHTDDPNHAGRSADWRLWLNGILLDTGNLAHGDAFGPLSPRSFSLPIAVAAGDVVKLEFERTHAFGTYCCVQMAITKSSLYLRSPVPGRAGAMSSFEIRGAQPLGAVRLGYGMATANNSLPGCSGVPLCLAAPQLIATLTANSNGVVTYARQIPANLQGRTIHFQAAELGACRSSNLVSHRFG